MGLEIGASIGGPHSMAENLTERPQVGLYAANTKGGLGWLRLFCRVASEEVWHAKMAKLKPGGMSGRGGRRSSILRARNSSERGLGRLCGVVRVKKKGRKHPAHSLDILLFGEESSRQLNTSISLFLTSASSRTDTAAIEPD